MPIINFHLWALIRHFDDGTVLAEALCFPEISCISRKRRSALRRLKKLARTFLQEADEIYRRSPCGAPEVRKLEVELEPTPGQVGWENAISVSLHYVTWQHRDVAQLAYFPSLQIAVIVNDPDKLEAAIDTQARLALRQRFPLDSLEGLISLPREEELEVEELEFTIDLQSPKQRAIAEAEGEDEAADIVKQTVTDLTRLNQPRAFEIDDAVRRLADLLATPRRPSILLVGPPGVGKTAIFHELVRTRAQHHLSDTAFWSTTGARIVAGASGFGMWQKTLAYVAQEASKAKAILHLDHLRELMEVGKGEGQSISLAGFLQTYVTRGDLVVIAECSSEELPTIEREEPQLLEAFLQFKVDEPTDQQTRLILGHYVDHRKAQQRLSPTVDPQALNTIHSLHHRYAAYSASPGRPLRFLANLLDDSPESHRVTPNDVSLAFSRETGLPLLLLQDELRFSMDETRQRFSQRVMGQPEAVDLVADLLAMVKTRLTRPGRPIASLLFIGPTGVGKTEMAKSLAEFMYQDTERIVRFDMSEFADPLSVDRLIGGTFATTGLLTKRVREQPFTIVLFDELEKADPSFFDLLLQILGDGRLTDSAGRVADFTNSFVIMTSNLGADSYGQAMRGFAPGTDDGEPSSRFPNDDFSSDNARRHFVQKVRDFFRPELFNRIDSVVPFAPLNPATILSIAGREIDQLMRRDGLANRSITLDIGDDVIEFLADRGYEPRYGARPLKRAVQRRLVVPLAEQLSEQPFDVSLHGRVTLERNELQVDVTRDDGQTRRNSRATEMAHCIHVASQLRDLRRLAQRLTSSSIVAQLRSKIMRREVMDKYLRRKPPKHQSLKHRFNRNLTNLKTLANRVAEFHDTCIRVERDALLQVYQDQFDAKKNSSLELSLQETLKNLLIDLLASRSDSSTAMTLAVLGLSPSHVLELAAVYESLTAEYAPSCFVLYRHAVGRKHVAHRLAHRFQPKEENAVHTSDAVQVPSLNVIQDSPPVDMIGVLFSIQGRDAFPRFVSEGGLHPFITKHGHEHHCIVEVLQQTFQLYEPPGLVGGRFVDASTSVRRTYRLFDNNIVDHGHTLVEQRKSISMRKKTLYEVIEKLVEDAFRKFLESLLN